MKHYLSLQISGYGQPLPADELTNEFFQTHKGAMVTVVYGQKQDVEWLEINRKFFKFITIFAENAPEKVEKRLGLKDVNELSQRVEIVRKTAFILCGWRENEVVWNENTGTAEIRFVAKSVTKLTAREYQKAFVAVREMLLVELMQSGWKETDCKAVFGELYTK